MKRLLNGFTLVEVNLAIVVMAMGILAMVSLFSLGFRENRQSVEDVAATTMADQVFAPIVAALSDTNLAWSTWCAKGSFNGNGNDSASQVCDGLLPDSQGWRAYVTDVQNDDSGDYQVKSDCNGTARKDVFDKLVYGSSVGAKWPSNFNDDYYYGLVASRRGATISLSFRASRRRDALLNQPVYYTEVHFQGRTDR